jgi:RNA polymerase sigma-70 factor (ECF subfamily)
MTARLLAYESAERAARESYGRLLAYLAPRCGIDEAEEALADAFAAALEHWPSEGVPRKPEAWLLVAARRRFIDRARRARRELNLHDRLAHAAQDAQRAFESSQEPEDERLGLLFACAHPAIAPEVRAPLMLQVALGLDAARIASAFLVAPSTMSQRLVRAKRKIASAGIPLRVPEAEDFPQRLDAVLSAIYAAFSEGWGDPAGIDARSRGLTQEALWLGRLVLQVRPDEPEAIGLVALMLYAQSRRAARRDTNAAYVALDEQDVSLWDTQMIEEAEALVRRASAAKRPGRFQIEAAIQSAHAVRRYGSPPDWDAIVAMYDALFRITASPVVALNRAVAMSHIAGAQAGLAALDAIEQRERLEEYQPYWAARADLLARGGLVEEACAAYDRARGLTIDPAIRDYLTCRIESIECRPENRAPSDRVMLSLSKHEAPMNLLARPSTGSG